jgi:hypothetical protein
MKTAPADLLLSRLDKVRETGKGCWLACCPAHPDKSPSLSIRELPDGRVLLHCFTGCSVDAVVGAIGLELSDLFPTLPEDGYKPVKRPFPATDVLTSVSLEIAVVLAAASDMLDSGDLIIGREGFERLTLAHDRLQAALTVLGTGRHG